MQTAARLLCPASTLPPPPLLPGSTKSAGHSFPPRGDGVVPTQNGWRQTAVRNGRMEEAGVSHHPAGC